MVVNNSFKKLRRGELIVFSGEPLFCRFKFNTHKDVRHDIAHVHVPRRANLISQIPKPINFKENHFLRDFCPVHFP